MTSGHKIFLTGGDQGGWALDTDLGIARRALASLAKEIQLEDSDIVHSVWWEPLLGIPKDKLQGKRVVCQVSGEPFRYLSNPRFHQAINLVGCWISQTTQAQRELSDIGIPSELVPYAVDTDVFKPVAKNAPELEDLRHRLALPARSYLVGNFHRDSEGRDLHAPKLTKGPDIFLEIIAGLLRQNVPVHVLLAGPRRHWVRSELRKRQIPFTFVGREIEQDDVSVNTLPADQMRLLYGLVDAYVVSSRSEGGPRTLLEACSAHCKAISTPVGLAPDLLAPACLYSHPQEAADLLRQDHESGFLSAFTDAHHVNVERQHTISAAANSLARLYGNVDAIPVFRRRRTPGNRKKSWFGRCRSTFRVGLWHKFTPPPFGGGNQFMRALRKGLLDEGVSVSENRISSWTDAYVLNAVWFDIERFRKHMKNRDLRILHRIDGLVILGRGRDRHLDDLCFDLNSEMASATVLQSEWVYRKIISMGYRPVNPTIIHNAADAAIFNSSGRLPFDRKRKIRLISTSWSDNVLKGGPVYKWLEEHLDWSRFEYTFVGKCSEPLARARHIPPVPSEQLADLLRQHDIYITAARNDACSNALIEALSCGLPALYVNDGGHAELVGQGGMAFDDKEEIPALLDRMVNGFETFQALIAAPDMREVTAKYLSILRNVSQ